MCGGAGTLPPAEAKMKQNPLAAGIVANTSPMHNMHPNPTQETHGRGLLTRAQTFTLAPEKTRCAPRARCAARGCRMPTRPAASRSTRARLPDREQSVTAVVRDDAAGVVGAARATLLGPESGPDVMQGLSLYSPESIGPRCRSGSASGPGRRRKRRRPKRRGIPEPFRWTSPGTVL
jgi:hypothetical protein